MPSSRTDSSTLSILGLNDSKDKKLNYRIVILGNAKVGKTSIVRRLLSLDGFEERHKPTIEELYQNEYKLKGSDLTLKLDLLDTSGTYPFPAMRKLAIETGDAFILVYSIDDSDSFDQIRCLKDSIISEKNKIPPIVVVGNKSDLKEKRVIKRELAEIYAAIDWEIGFLECSAKNNENIFKIFKELLNQKQTQTIRKSIEERNERIINSRISKPKVSLKPNNCTIS